MRRKQGKEKNRISMKRQRREKGAEGEGYGKKEWERACNISPEICCIMMVVGYEDIIFIQLLIHKMKGRSGEWVREQRSRGEKYIYIFPIPHNMTDLCLVVMRT